MDLDDLYDKMGGLLEKANEMCGGDSDVNDPSEAIDALTDLIDDGKLKFKNDGNIKVTYHDSCRLGRHMGIYDTPRDILADIPGVELVEMERNREKAACCGVSAFATCESSSKKMQVERLMEGKKTGAEKMLMFCPKCQIHFKCTTWKEMPVEKELVDIPIDDMTTFVAEHLE